MPAVKPIHLTKRLTQAQVDMLRYAAHIVYTKDNNHCDTLAALTALFGRVLKLSEDQLFGLYCGSYLHDVGKVAIPEAIWFKPGRLSPEEFAIMKTHTTIGYEICRPIDAFALALPIIRHHHEKWDGSGYPDGLKREDIPFLARIFQVLDIYDALRTDRSYRRAATHYEAIGAMTDGGLDPRLLLAFARIPLSAHHRAKSAFPPISGGPDAIDGVSPRPLQTEFYSCFISHSSRDAAIAKKLSADLRKRGIKCWYAPEDLKTGAPLRGEIDKSIRLHDRLLVILSESSVASPWVEAEVEAAIEEERRRSTLQAELRGNPIVLFPIRIDDSIFTVDNGWAAVIKRTRNIGDFCSWRTSQSYQVALERLIGDLAVSDEVDSKARAARRQAAAGLTV